MTAPRDGHDDHHDDDLGMLADRPWKRVLFVVAALFFLWVVLPWLLDASPMNITSAGAPFSE